MSTSIIIYGAGGHGLVVAEAADAAGFDVLGFKDEYKSTGSVVGKWTVIDSRDQSDDAMVIVAIGDNVVRDRLTTELASNGYRLATVIHPTAMISPSAKIGPGTFVGPFAVVHPEATIGTGVIINSRAVVEHHNRIGSAAHIAPGAVLCGNVSVGNRTMMGAACVAIPKVTIGQDCVVGAGSVVISDVPDRARAVGNPVRLLD